MNVKKHILLTTNGDVKEILGKSSREPKWKDINSFKYRNGKYEDESSKQRIPLDLTQPSISIPSLKTKTIDKKNYHTVYKVRKEVLQLIVFATSNEELTKDLPFTINKESFRWDELDMTPLFWSCFEYYTTESSFIEFLRKRYINYEYQRDRKSCYVFPFWENILYRSYWERESDNDIVGKINIYYCKSLFKTSHNFFKKLEKYGNYTINTEFPSENEFGIKNHKELKPSKRYIELRKNSDAYKKYVKEHDSDKDFDLRQEAAIDVLQGLGAALEKNAYKSVTGYNFSATVESSTNSLYDRPNDKINTVYMSKVTPLITKPITSSKNKNKHIWNFIEFLNDDILITVDGEVEKVLNGNLFENVNIPETGKSSDVLIKDSFTLPSLANLGANINWDYYAAIANQALDSLKKYITVGHNFDKRTKSEFVYNASFIDELIKLHSTLNHKDETLKKTVERLTNLSQKYPFSQEVKVILEEFKTLKKFFDENPITDIRDTRLASVYYKDGVLYTYRFILMEYYANYLDSLKNKQLRLTTRNYDKGVFYNPEEHPLLTQYVEIPEVKWYSNESLGYCKEVIKKIFIPNIINEIIEGINNSDKLKRKYIYDIYRKELNEKYPLINELNEYPILPIMGVFDKSSYSSSKNDSNEIINKENDEVVTYSNSIYNFNKLYFESWNLWNSTKHIQIRIPDIMDSIYVFKFNLQKIVLSFPNGIDMIDNSGIQILADSNNIYFKEESNDFYKLTSFKVPVVNIEKESIRDESVSVYIPKYLKKNVSLFSKRIQEKDIKFIVLGYYLDGNKDVPLRFQNFKF